MSTINQKPDPKKLTEMESELIRLRGAVRNADLVLSLRGSAGWDAVMESLNERLSAIEERLDNTDKLSDHQIRAILQERKDWRFMTYLLDRIEANLPNLQQQLVDTEKAIKERKARLGATHS